MKDTNSGDSISSKKEAYQKSIEEIVEELEHLVQWETPEHEKEVKDWLTQTLEAERQKCEDVRTFSGLVDDTGKKIYIGDIIECEHDEVVNSWVVDNHTGATFIVWNGLNTEYRLDTLDYLKVIRRYGETELPTNEYQNPNYKALTQPNNPK